MINRQSVNDANSPIATGTIILTGSDYQAVDDTPSVFSVLWSLIVKIWWAFVIVIGLAAISFPYFFPEWAEKHKNALVEMRTVADSFKFIENAKSVHWSEALTAENIRGLYLVGTGLHPLFDKKPGLRAGAWYMGNNVLIMKEPVPMYGYLNFLAGIKEHEPQGDGLLPATDIDHIQASAYCESIEGRLPTLKEIIRAYRLAFTKEWQGKTGDFLKPNLIFRIAPGQKLWTNTPEDDSFTGKDNFAVFAPGQSAVVYEDDGYEDEQIGFVCAMDVKTGNK